MKNKGFTLIETLIYIALLSILMIGVFSSVFIFIDNENQPNQVEKDSELLNQTLP